MKGKSNVRFSEQFTSTLETHGMVFTFDYYVITHKMPVWEFKFWYDNYSGCSFTV